MNDVVNERRERYGEAVRRALDWLAAQQGADSSFGLSVSEGVTSIFVTPLTFLWGGLPWRALGVIERIRTCFVREDGSLFRPMADKMIIDRRQLPYALSWVIRSSAVCGALDISHICLPQLAAFQDKACGGLFGTREEAAEGTGIIDLACTGMGGLAFLATGLSDRAKAAGDYVVEWLARQENVEERLLCQWHTEKGLMDEESGRGLPENANAPLVIGQSAPHTGYWLCGILTAFLAELYQVTSEGPYLEAARAIFSFAARSPELGKVCTSHKFAWGAARLFAVTRDPEHLEGACRAADRLVEAQRPEGYFVYADYFPGDGTPPHDVNVGVTSQFTAWMSAAAMHLPVG